jgi:hypothetical protein
VLFGQEDAPAQARANLARAPAGLSTAEFLAWGLTLIARRFEGRRDEMRVVTALIDSDDSLRERALRKREMLNSLLGEALRSRGLDERRSRLLAEATIGALYVALERWLATDTATDVGVRLDALALDALAALREDLSGIDQARPPAPPPPS